MLFVGGPRQVGKTTLCKVLMQEPAYNAQSAYLNWDNDDDRRIITQKLWLRSAKLVVFDELHKYRNWKQWIKGVYDKKPDAQHYTVTGSARLDIYKKGGDSLMGRYHYWRVHPLTLDEIPEDVSPADALERLLTLGGFPEPFLKADTRLAKRWRKERFAKVLREDVRDLTFVRDLKLLELFSDALRERAGQLIVLSNLAEDLQIHSHTAKAWLELLEAMYVGFSIYPLSHNVPRAIQKPPKFYFYDNADTRDSRAVRLENLVATTLQKRLHFQEDFHGQRCQLHYLRDRDQREVDFATVVDGKLDLLIEVKTSDTKLSPSLRYYAEKLKPRMAVQLVGNLEQSFEKNGIVVMHPLEFFMHHCPFPFELPAV